MVNSLVGGGMVDKFIGEQLYTLNNCTVLYFCSPLSRQQVLFFRGYIVGELFWISFEIFLAIWVYCVLLGLVGSVIRQASKTLAGDLEL